MQIMKIMKIPQGDAKRSLRDYFLLSACNYLFTWLPLWAIWQTVCLAILALLWYSTTL